VSLKLTNDGVLPGGSVTPNLNFGGLQVPISFRVSSSGVASFSGNKSVDSGWVRFCDSPAPSASFFNQNPPNPPEGDLVNAFLSV